MQLEVSFQQERGYLLTTICGEWEPTALTKALTLIRDKAQQTASSRILLDASHFLPPKIEFHRFLAGQALAAQLPRPLKIAVLYKEEWINKFAENVAVNRGAHVFVCTEKAEALRWLLEESPDVS